jgi:hypothetical protein
MAQAGQSLEKIHWLQPLPVDLATVSDAQYDYLARSVVNPVDDAVIAHTDAPAIGTTGELDRAARPGRVLKRQHRTVDTGSDLVG